MRTNNSINGGLRFYVSVMPALFPAIVFFSISTAPSSLRVNYRQMLGKPIVERVKDIYTSQIGVRETRPNSGPEVEKYLKYVHLPKGNPWCAAFVCWVFGKAGVENPRTGWSPDLFGERRVVWSRGDSRSKSQESRLLRTLQIESRVKNQEPRLLRSGLNIYPLICDTNIQKPTTNLSGTFQNVLRHYLISLTTNNQQITTPGTGDIFGLYFPEQARIAHVGFIDKWDGTWLITVEGNTNVYGSREGDGVYRKRRLVTSINKVARYIHR